MTEQAKALSPISKYGALTVRLLDWYARNRRVLPWRSLPGVTPEPYHVWLSEVMLQQTTVVTVMPRFQAFLQRWPTVKALAAASLDEVLHEWQGLGYYARARNLHACAVQVAHDLGGQFPGTEAGLRDMPGIGEYTSAAIAAIAFGQITAPVDGNIIRVISRLERLETPMPSGKKEVTQIVSRMAPDDRPGDFAQAMMDLGAMVCRPRNPICTDCPWMMDCRAFSGDEQERFPVKKPKGEKPTRYGTVFWVMDTEGRVLLGRRPEKGLLGGMMEFPSTDWREQPWDKTEAISSFPATMSKSDQNQSWQVLTGSIRHTFTHFHLVLNVLITRLSEEAATQSSNGIWCRPEDFHRHALPTVMKKVAMHVNAELV